ncbi:helix-turn-helix transcriptional regulator [bacterium]|nr:helix-turn-helix transcriptional regulator [bacterium]
MTPRPRLAEPVPSRGGEIEQRFAWLLDRMRDRYLAGGYELDDVHLAQILGVHPGVLRKGKFSSVSPSLAQAAAEAWDVDLNWLLLGRGREPSAQGPLSGLEQIPRETRVARGRWSDAEVRRLMREKGLSQKDLAARLGIPQARAGALARGQLRDPDLRESLAGILGVPVEHLFLVTGNNPPEETALETADTGGLYSLSAVRGALSRILDEHLEAALGSGGRTEHTLEFVPDGISLAVPPPAPSLSELDRLRYERNREVLERWSRSRGAFSVPAEVAGRFCREVSGFYEGGRVDDVGHILRDYISEADQAGGQAGKADPARLQLQDNVLIVGGTQIEVDDPELLARIPEYLNTRTGRLRLLEWLRSNVGGR